MAITYQKRMKEMKRLEVQREKAERRAQKKLAKRAEKEAALENVAPIETPKPEVPS
jgi:transcription elongation GreA/GreB family factor